MNEPAHAPRHRPSRCRRLLRLRGTGRRLAPARPAPRRRRGAPRPHRLRLLRGAPPRFGVFTPRPTARARKLCPRLIVLPGDFDKYEHFARWMFSYAQDFTPDVEIASIDEGYFDLSAVPRPPLHVAETIRAAIRQSLKISVSEGIGSNKLVSQIASKLTKPAAFQAVPAGQEIAFLHPLANKWLPGVGPKTSPQLTATRPA